MKYLLNLPPTKEAQELKADWDKLNQELKLVYKLEPESQNYVFAGEYNPEADGIKDDENAVILPISSVYMGTVSWAANSVFCNILKSSGDPGYDQYGNKKSWRDLAINAGISWDCHAQQDIFYDCQTGQRVPSTTQKSYKCGGMIVGGHVMQSMVPAEVNRNAIVYVLPICHNHNSMGVNHEGTAHPTPGNGNGFFMRLRATTKVLQLRGYAPSSNILPQLANAQILD